MNVKLFYNKKYKHVILVVMNIDVCAQEHLRNVLFCWVDSFFVRK